MSLPEGLGLFFLSLLAEILGTVGGFGSSLFFVPLALFFLDYHTVLGLTAVFHVLSNLSKISLFRKGTDRFLLVYMGVPAVAFVLLGGWLSQKAGGFAAEVFLSGLLIGFSLLFLFRPRLVIEATRRNAALGGGLSGFVAGLLGTGGAIRGMVLAAFHLPKDIFIATSAWIDMGVDLSRSLLYYSQGYVKTGLLSLLPALAVSSFLGTWIGKKLLGHIPEERFRQLVLTLIFATGLVLAYKTIFQKPG